MTPMSDHGFSKSKSVSLRSKSIVQANMRLNISNLNLKISISSTFAKSVQS